MKPRIVIVTHTVHAVRNEWRLLRANYIDFIIKWSDTYETGPYNSIPEAMEAIAWRDRKLQEQRDIQADIAERFFFSFDSDN